MQRTTKSPQRERPTHRRRGAQPGRVQERRGTILVVILALLTLLALLGITFYTFATQEDVSSQYFSDSAKAIEPRLPSDVCFNWALEQLILGPSRDLQDSALYGRKHSLVPNLIGDLFDASNPQQDGRAQDLHPHDGGGRHIGFDDLNGNRIQDAGETVFFRDDGYTYSGTHEIPRMNFTRGANIANGLGGNAPELFKFLSGAPNPLYYRPDAGYTYPDINSPFLAYNGKAYQFDNAGNVINSSDVIIPSFLRPQYLRLSDGTPITDWATRSSTADLVLRPHVEHRNAANDATRRFIRPGENVPNAAGNPVQPFPFPLRYQQGVWNNNPGGTVQYDVDNDGDGIKEGIWLDLDFPVQEMPLPDVRKYIAMFSYTVLDGDAKLNVNLHGQLNSAAITGINQNFGNGEFVTKSNQGRSPAELNLGRALFADLNDSSYVDAATKDSTIEQHARFYNIPLGVYPNRLTTSNMETAFLLWGRPHWNTSGTIEDLLSGRWGDVDQLNQIFLTGALPKAPPAFPRSGNIGADDNRDANDPQLRSRLGLASNDPFLSAGIPPFVHPLDLRGTGAGHQFGLLRTGFAPNTGARRNLRPFVAGNTRTPAKWAFYQRGFQTTELPPNSFLTYLDADGGSLFPSPDAWHIDDADETIVDRTAPSNVLSRDAIFYPDEMAGLHLSDADFTRIGGGSRLRRLLPLNFELNKKAAQIRRQFTTDSWDRLEFGLRGLTPFSKRPWEFGWEDANADGTLSPVEDWDQDQQNDRIFPPVFGFPTAPVLPSRHNLGVISPNDPFRPEVRRLLTTLSENRTPSQLSMLPQFRLDLNRLLIGFDQNSKPVYRNLTPHPVFEATDPAATNPQAVQPLVYTNVEDPRTTPYGNTTVQNFQRYPQGTHRLKFESDPANTKQYKIDQEWWARYDRQRLAQDIYVLLYLLGGGNDNANVVGAAPTYTLAQVREMAQFAVNYVDALDRDDVITKFVFDRDLHDGWNPDPSDANTVVYGVETHALSLNEALVVRAEELQSDRSETLFDDTEAPRHYVFVELQNASPFPVPMSGGTWRLRCEETQKSIIFRDATSNGNGEIPPGGQYTIGSSDGTDTFESPDDAYHRPSELRIDYDGDQRADRIVPAIPDSGQPPQKQDGISNFPRPELDVDLVFSDPNRPSLYEDRFEIRDGDDNTLTTKGDFVTGIETLSQVTFVLERLPHPVPPRHLDQEQQWLEVDRLRVDRKDFNLEQSGSTVDAELAKLTSNERREALHRPPGIGAEPASSGIDSYRFNSIGLTLNTVAVDSQLWQPHFNRDFASPIDLLSIPLYTYDVSGGTASGRSLLDNLGEQVGSEVRMTGLMTAGVQKFLNPDPNPGASAPDEQNRWYRLLEFVEVPSRTHQELPNKVRIPGRINLNTLRDPHVLAALVDDETHLDFTTNDPTTGEPTLADRLEGMSRHWWYQFLRARDQFDPVTGFYLPGLPGSRPFHSLSHVGDGKHSLQNTLLRDLPMDRPQPELVRRSLFEARTAADANPGNTAAYGKVDYHTRQRLLSKIANLATNRSNVFYVWITVGFFEVVQDPANPEVIRIGAQMPDVPGYRGFFLVDRSQLEQAYDPSSGTFSYKAFVTYRKQIQ